MELMSPGEYQGVLEELGCATLAPKELARRLGREQFVAFITTHGLHNLFFLCKSLLGYDLLSPTLHREMCDFTSGPALRKGHIIPRGHYKSTVITIGKNIQKALRDSEVRIAIFHEKSQQAEGFLGSIGGHFERNKIIRELYPERCPKLPISKTARWSKSEKCLPRLSENPEATFSAHGYTSAQQGFHYTDMTWDDLIGEEAANNPEIMQKVINWMMKGESLSVTPHTLRLDICGTRWAYEDAWSWAMENMTIEWFTRSAVVKDEVTGTPSPLFPEQFTMEILNELARRDFYIFSCQYLNEPSSPKLQDFHPEWLRYYTKTTRRTEGGHEYAYAMQRDQRPDEPTDGERLGHMVVLIHCDPGLGLLEGQKKAEARHSKSAIMVVGLAWPRRVFLLDAFIEKVPTDEYIKRIVDYFQIYEPYVRWITHEAHGWTSMVRTQLIKHAAERNLYISESRCKPYTKSSNMKKEARIRKLVDWFRGGNIFIQQGEYDLEREYRSFPLSLRPFDGLDALAQGPDYWEPFPEAPEYNLPEDISPDTPDDHWDNRTANPYDPTTGLYGS